MKSSLVCLLLGALPAAVACGHDTWLQANTPIIRRGDAVYVDFVLGNHGNEHRDFKIAGKPPFAGSAIQIIGPDGASADLKPSFADRGLTAKEGYYTARLAPSQAGLYLVAQTADQIASYAPERIVRSAKTFFLVCDDLDRVPANAPGFDRVLGHALELVPEASTVAPIGAGLPIRVRLLFQGRPLADEKISFVPMGVTLAAGFDPRYERRTDASGSASFVPPEANQYLIVCHHVDSKAKGTGYAFINYCATLTVMVPGFRR